MEILLVRESVINVLVDHHSSQPCQPEHHYQNKHIPSFKVRAALEASKGEETTAGLANRFKFTPARFAIGLGNYFRFYNTERPNQALGYRTPAEVFASTPLEATSTGMVESLTPDPLRIVEPDLNIVPILS